MFMWSSSFLELEWEHFSWLLFLFLCYYALKNEDLGFTLMTATITTVILYFISNLLQRKHSEASVESSKIVKKPVTNELPTGRKKKEKKKKKQKENEEPNMSNPKKTKIYNTLQVFESLGMEEADIYHSLYSFILTPNQLAMNNYPRENLLNPGHIIVKVPIPEDPTLRSCVRCKQNFTISEAGEYGASNACWYHPLKLTYSQGPPVYQCCLHSSDHPGCENYSFHVTVEKDLRSLEFKRIREKRQVKKEAHYSVYALDCEMSFTTGGLEVTKIGVVGVDGQTVYESFVQPENTILDYNTRFSGVTAQDLKGVSTTLSDVQDILLKLFNNKTILVGHALNNDLEALRLIHDKVVDTSVVFPHKFGGILKRSLKSVAKQYLGRTIQNSADGHDCIDDARTCIELMLKKIKPSSIESNRNVKSLNNQSLRVTKPARVVLQPCKENYNPNVKNTYGAQQKFSDCNKSELFSVPPEEHSQETWVYSQSWQQPFYYTADQFNYMPINVWHWTSA